MLAPMRPIRSLVLFILLVFVGGALLAPWLYWLAQWTGLESLTQMRFYRFVKRGMLVVALAGMWPFVRSLGVRSWSSVGIGNPAGRWTRLGVGFALGFGSLALAAALALIFGARQLDGGIGGRWWGRVPRIALTAAVVGTLEELLFRGALFGALRRAHGWRMALLVSSAAYAIVHFFQTAESTGPVTWSSGLELLPRLLLGLAQPAMLLPGLITLTLVGAILALAFQRTGNLYFSIGLHAGWIFWLKFYVVMTDLRLGAPTWFWGTGKLYDGYLALLALGTAGFFVWKLPQTKTTPEAGAELGNDSTKPRMETDTHESVHGC
jgi:membrane protease YdiL (CAAX protease family)